MLSPPARRNTGSIRVTAFSATPMRVSFAVRSAAATRLISIHSSCI
jgi:hypothetical protein